MHKPFDRLGNRLLAAGIAPRHVRRYLSELGNHLDDLAAEEKQAGRDPAAAAAMALSRLGTEDDLATAMAGRPQFRSWTARAPWATFVIGPPTAMAAIITITVLLTVLFVQSHRPSPTAQPDLPSWFGAVSALVFRFESLVLPILLGWAVAALAIRQRVLSLWPALGLAVIAVFGAAAELSVTLPQPGMPGEVSFGMQLHAAEIYRAAVNLILAATPYLLWRRFVTGGQTRQS